MEFDILYSSSMRSILENYALVQKARQKAAFNLFTISSYTSHLENFHSDIIAMLLDKNGVHQEQDRFMKQFINYLHGLAGINIRKDDFENTTVIREQGRLDIWIRDEVSRKAIIIENKVNNAPDMVEQIDRYYQYSQELNGYNVELIIYLSLDGFKLAPKTSSKIDHLVRNIGVFTGMPDDLVTGWLKNCLDDHINQDSYTFIYQYISLLKNLANKNMDIQVMEDFYRLLSNENAFENINNIVEMKNRLPSYRADRFAAALGDSFTPFVKQIRYKSNYYLLDNYKVNSNIFKLDVWFEENGNAALMFWNTSEQSLNGRLALTQELNRIR
ncbi:MAG: hypothetical protein JWR09_5636 [Mucilaginibacter sp.]|nr:hypothetical protein [Mucilaginibacter sp.]